MVLSRGGIDDYNTTDSDPLPASFTPLPDSLEVEVGNSLSEFAVCYHTDLLYIVQKIQSPHCDDLKRKRAKLTRIEVPYLPCLRNKGHLGRRMFAELLCMNGR